jgi:outer membrane receptor protein involved in Fe transport
MGGRGGTFASGLRRCYRVPAWVTALGFAFSLADPVHAAPASGDIEGIVRDDAGHPLPSAELRVETTDGRVLARGVAREDGTFRFTAIAPGEYVLVAEQPGFAPTSAPVTLSAETGASAELSLSSVPTLATTAVIAQRLDTARAEIEPRLGASTFTIPEQAIAAQPRGDDNPLNQVVLQAPGVSQEAFGQLHVRNEMANLQFRLNGVILPEGVSFFGQSLSPRFASSVELITGALPAQYGLRTAGIIDISTKSGAYDNGGYAGVYGGSQGWLQPSAAYGGSAGAFNYFVSADYLQNGIGIENPTPSYRPIHDDTEQGHGFAYLERILDATSRASLVLGTFQGQFQIPDIPGKISPGLGPTGNPITVGGVSTFDSAALDENQCEINDYAVLSYLKTTQSLDFQVSGFTRYSSLTFHPDPIGDLIFNGIAEDAYRRSFASGLQAESSLRLAADHTVRSGVIVTGERSLSRTNSSVVPTTTNPDGSIVQAGPPETIADNGAKTGWSYSAYLQDEWHATSTLTVNYGGRFDVVDTVTHENQLSPRINVVWQATPSTTLHAGYANYFSPPPFELFSVTSLAKFAGTSAAPEVTENAPVKAERDHYFDLGAAQEIMKGLKVGLDGYYKYARNLIDIGQFGAPIIFTPFNYHLGRNLGVELTASYVRGNFALYGNLALAYQKAKGIASAQFNFSAEELAFLNSHTFQTDHSQIMTASGGASYLWRETRFSIDMLAGSGLRASDPGAPNGRSLPSWEQVNLGVAHRFELPIAGALELRLDVFNIFDEIYRIRDGTGVSVGAPQFGPRRTVFAGVRKEF